MGCAATSTRGSAGISRAITHLLLVAARQRRGQRGRAAAADVVLLEQAGGALAHARRSAASRAATARACGTRAGRGSRRGELEDEPAALAVLGDVRDAGGGPSPRAPASRHVVARRPTIEPASTVRRPVIASIELALAVAVDAGEADDLARAHRQRDAAHRGQPAVVAHVRGRGPRARGSFGARRRLLDAQQHVAADHQPRQRSSVAPSVGHRVDLLAAPQHGDAVGDVEHLVELVRDEDDRRCRRPSAPAQHAEQVLRLLRGEHGGRLVEHEHPARRGTARAGSPRAAACRRRGPRPRASGSTARP